MDRYRRHGRLITGDTGKAKREVAFLPCVS